MSFNWNADQVYRMLNAYRVLESLDVEKQGRFIAELQSLIVQISFENMEGITGRMLKDSPCDYVDETSDQNVERVNVLRPVREQPIPLPYYLCLHCKSLPEMKPEKIDVGVNTDDREEVREVSDLPSPLITGSGMNTQSISASSSLSDLSSPVLIGGGYINMPLKELFKSKGVSAPVSVSTPKVPVASRSGVTPPVKIPSGSVTSRGAVSKKKDYRPLPFLPMQVAMANASELAMKLENDRFLWQDARNSARGCWNCGGPHVKSDCTFDRGTFCGSCGYPGIPGDMCPLCYPKRAWGLSPPSWYRGAKKDDAPK